MKAYYLTNDQCIVEISIDEWAKHGSQRINLTERHGIKISTVFLGLPHAGGMFETMVFGGPYDQEMIRCDSYKDAVLVHTKLVEFFNSLNWFERYLDGNIAEKRPLKSITYNLVDK